MIDALGEIQKAAFLYKPHVEAALGVEIGPVEVVYSPDRPHATVWVEYRNNAMRICMTPGRATSSLSVERVHKAAMHELAHLASIKVNPDLYFRGLTYVRRFVTEGFAEFVSLEYLGNSYSPAVPDIRVYLARQRQSYLDDANKSWPGKVPESLLALIGHLGSSRRPVWKRFISPYPFGYRFFRAIAEESGGDWPGENSTLERLVDVIMHPDIPLAQILRPNLYMEAHSFKRTI